MTIEDARKLIPPGWVECDREAYNQNNRHWFMSDEIEDVWIYAIPAPKPEPRRVPMGEMVIAFDQFGWRTGVSREHDFIRNSAGGNSAVANTKWRLDPDTREWVEVLS